MKFFHGKKAGKNEEEAIRLAIQAGIVASCLVVAMNDWGSFPEFLRVGIRFLAVVYGLISMSYIMLTARTYGYGHRYDFKIREKVYDCTVDVYWIFGFTIAFQFLKVLFSLGNWIYLVLVVTDLLMVIFLVWMRKRKC